MNWAQGVYLKGLAGLVIKALGWDSGGLGSFHRLPVGPWRLCLSFPPVKRRGQCLVRAHNPALLSWCSEGLRHQGLGSPEGGVTWICGPTGPWGSLLAGRYPQHRDPSSSAAGRILDPLLTLSLLRASGHSMQHWHLVTPLGLAASTSAPWGESGPWLGSLWGTWGLIFKGVCPPLEVNRNWEGALGPFGSQAGTMWALFSSPSMSQSLGCTWGCL